MKTKLITLFLLSIPFLSLAQTPINDLVWVAEIHGMISSVNDRVSNLTVDKSDNSIISGRYLNTGNNSIRYQGNTLINYINTTQDIALIKLDSNADFVWSKSILADKWIRLMSQKTDNLNNIILYLQSDSTVHIDNHVLPKGEMILKLDSNANYLWHLPISGTMYGGYQMMELNNHNDIILAGHFRWHPTSAPDTLKIGNNIYPPSAQHNFFVSKIKTDATVVWTKQFTYNHYPNMIISALDVSNNGIFLTGSVMREWVIDNDTINADTTSISRSFLIRFNNSGDIQWGKTYYSGVRTKDVSVSYTGDIYVSGYFYSQAFFGNDTLSGNGGASEMILMKMDESGSLQWAKQSYDNNTQNNSHLTATKSGDVILSEYGYASYEPLMKRFNANGNVEWKLTRPTLNTNSMNAELDYSGNLLMVGYFVGPVTFGNVTLNSPYPQWSTYLLKFANQDIIIPVNVIDGDGIQTDVKVFPNPALNQLTINSATLIKKLSLYDNMGILQLVYPVNDKEVIISLKKIEAGVYYLAIETNQKRFMKKIIKL